MKIFLIWLLISYILQIVTIFTVVYFSPGKPATIRKFIEELKDLHWILWTPVIGLVSIVLCATYMGCSYLWHKFLDLKIRR